MLHFSLISERELILCVAYVLVFASVFSLTRMAVQEQEALLAQDNLGDQRDRPSSNRLVKLLRPLITQYGVPMIRGKAFWNEKRVFFRRKLIAGGLKDEITPDEFLALKVINIFLFPIFAGMLVVLGVMNLTILQILATGGVGWWYPNFWVNAQVSARQKKVIRSMPFIVDLLALSTEAGLDFVAAIGKVVEKANPSPLVEEFSQMLKEIKVGSSRQEALREMALRIDLTQMSSFVAILISADQMGASIGKILRQQSAAVRAQRMLAAEKAGARAPTYIMLVIFLFIVPTVFLMIGAPILIGYIYGPKV